MVMTISFPNYLEPPERVAVAAEDDFAGHGDVDRRQEVKVIRVAKVAVHQLGLRGPFGVGVYGLTIQEDVRLPGKRIFKLP